MIQTLIDEAIKAERTKERVSSGKFSVSDAGKCHLMRYWKRQGKVGKGIDERVLRVFEVGHIFESWVLNTLEKKGLVLHRQLGVEDTHRKGFLDAIIQEKLDTLLTDCKTVHSRKFWRNNKQGWDSDIHYHFQLLTYYDMLPESLRSEITGLRLIYISKDDLAIEEVPVSLDNLDACKDDWQKLIDVWGTQVEPQPNPKDWECKYCIYTDICKGEKSGKNIQNNR